jgi:hypothetical protein
MVMAIVQITREELQHMIDASVERKLIEILGNPDEGLTLKQSVRERLLRQQKAVAAGERGSMLDDVARRLGLD